MPCPCSKLARAETIWVMMTGAADGLSQHGCCQACDNHLAAKDRHNYGHKVTPGGLPDSLPGRLTESTVGSEDRIWPGMDS